jgi:hypothetical protein
MVNRKYIKMINRKKFRKIPLLILVIIVFGMVALKSVAVDFEQAF